jgi:hypothetical protein
VERLLLQVEKNSVSNWKRVLFPNGKDLCFQVEETSVFPSGRCSARDWDGSGLLGGIPRVVVQISALTLKGPL